MIESSILAHPADPAIFDASPDVVAAVPMGGAPQATRLADRSSEHQVGAGEVIGDGVHPIVQQTRSPVRVLAPGALEASGAGEVPGSWAQGSMLDR
jgi:hypothetical protein